MYPRLIKVILVTLVFGLTTNAYAQTSLKAGMDVPNFEVASLDGGATISPASLKGKIYLVDFWATWCSPCVKALPELQSLYNQYSANGFTIVSLSMDQSTNAVSAFRKKKPMPWSNGFLEGGLENEIAQAFKVSGLPAAYLVDQNGKIIGTNKDLENGKLGTLLAAQFKK